MEDKSTQYSTIGGIVYQTLQTPQQQSSKTFNLQSLTSMLHDPYSFTDIGGSGIVSGYIPQYSFSPASQQAGVVPISYVRSYEEMIPLTFGRLGTSPTKVFPVATVPGINPRSSYSMTVSGSPRKYTNSSENEKAWNEAWSLYGSRLGLEDDVAYLYLLGQIEHESGGFKYMEEIASGSAYEGRVDLGNVHKGDGAKFKGRGPIQVTGRANYEKIYKNFFVPNGLGEYDIVSNPELASDPKIGSLLSIGWLATTSNGKKAIAAANKHDIEGATKAINGGYNGLDDRVARTNQLLNEYNNGNNIA